MSNSYLKGKRVLVTGGAKNVGKAICRRFAEQGAHVIVNFFHSLDASKETAAELRALGATVDVVRASVAQPAQVERMFDEIEAKYGKLDILVNNAASGALLPVDDIEAAHFDRALDTNLKGAFWCARRAARLMARAGGGAIVNVSSVGSTLVPANYLVVGTAKAALESLTRYLAVEYASLGIRVNGASSTLIDGDVAAQFPDPDNTKRSSIAATPLGRLATAEDLADVVLFLASDAARWITGQVIVADGGLSLCSEALSPRREWRAAAEASEPNGDAAPSSTAFSSRASAGVATAPATSAAPHDAGFGAHAAKHGADVAGTVAASAVAQNAMSAHVPAPSTDSAAAHAPAASASGAHAAYPAPSAASARADASIAASSPSSPVAAALANENVNANASNARGARPAVSADATGAPGAEGALEDDSDEIAVVGMGVALPGASDPEAFWQALLSGPELFGNVPPDRWDYRSFYSPDPSAEDKSYQSRSVFIERFEPEARLRAEIEAAAAPDELTTLWLRHSLRQALDGVRVRAGDRTSFLVGYTADGSQHLEEGMVLAAMRARLRDALDEAGAPPDERERRIAQIDAVLRARYARGTGELSEFFPHRVGLNAMRGVLPDDAEYMMVDTACSSSLYSVDLGIKSLLAGKHDVVACGGAFALAPRGSILFSKLHGLSKSGEVRPLDKACDGVLFADGAGVVILKRLKRALADGDRVLGVLKAFGSSSDGKGKAIYAPNSAGQSIAIDRAYRQTDVPKDAVDWVVAHATGTPAGDLAEFQSLRDMPKRDRPVYVTSNKSLVGHTGWAAGVVSLIQVLLALEHGRIPPQHRFSEPPQEFDIGASGFTIPTQAVDWPRKTDAARVAAVSGFGFGGTNGHLIVGEHRPDLRASKPAERVNREPLAIVGWSAKFPGLGGRDAIAAWLNGAGAAPGASFGLTYPLPSFDRVRMPPAVLRALDRCQLMALDAAHDMREQLRDYWGAHANAIGVVMGHMGPTRNAALYASRCYLDDIATAVRASVDDASRPALDDALARVAEKTKRLVPPTTENSFPGMMPNVIPARVANYHDLHGMNMTVDAGHASTLAAFEVASRFLRSGELDMVIVGGINGNSADEVQPAFDRPLAEGIVLFAVTTKSQADAAGLPVLAWVESGRAFADACAPQRALRDADGREVTYAGADGALAVLRALVGGEDAASVAFGNDRDRVRFGLRVDRNAPPASGESTRTHAVPDAPGTPAAASAPSPSAPVSSHLSASPPAFASVSASSSQPVAPIATDVRAETPAPVVPSAAGASTEKRVPIPATLKATDVAADGEPLGVARYRIDLQETPWHAGAGAIAYLPAGSVVVTDAPELLDGIGMLPADLLVLSTRATTFSRARLAVVDTLGEAALQGLIPAGTRHLRLLTSLHTSALEPDRLSAPSPELLKLHDLAFLALKQCYDGVAQQGSFIALLLDAVKDDVLHPDAGMFTGLAKALAIELPHARSLVVLTDDEDIRQGVAQAERESGAQHLLPVVALCGGRRLTPRVTRDAGELPADGFARLDPDSVVVAFGGARGITAELMKAVAEHFQPTIYLIGSSGLDTYGPDVFAGSDEAFARGRPDYIREQKALNPHLPLPAIIKAFERQADARAARRNIDVMKSYCGPNKVFYLRADVLDAGSVRAAVDKIVAAGQPVDLVVNAAGLNRSASINVKSFDDFVAVRDIKIRGYWNVRDAFGAAQPRAWCNFGSFIGLTGQAGETDYASGNDFLNTQAAHHRAALARDEFTIGWTLWRSVGLGANPVTRAFLEKSGLFTSMRTNEGIHHFLREINLTERAASSVHLGAAERRAIEAHLPTFFETPESAPAARTERSVQPPGYAPNVQAAPGAHAGQPAQRSHPAPPRERIAPPPSHDFYLGREVRRTSDSVTFERVFDLRTDAYLQHHVVNRFATLPGTFVPELAAEAAMKLLPGLRVVGFRDAAFRHFLRVYDAQRPSTKRIHAQVVGREGDAAVVQVRITGDVLGPNGQVLVQDKLHFEIKALVAPRYASAPVWPMRPDEPRTPVADPYHFESAPVRLTGMFVSTADTGVTASGKVARYQLSVAPDDPVFSRFVVPSIMLDGLARVAVLNYVAGDYIPLAAPVSIGRIDLYEGGNDCELARRYRRIDLYATPREFALEGAHNGNRFAAVRPDGRMLMEMSDVSGVVIGYVHRTTGAYATKAEVDALAARLATDRETA
ncbi:SDR family oxidoreductase [Burkholderia oklahomensis]|uniref:SDR family oxidoreductase n=1 Tax=Burkholderia oklahomensis TaxID=342113 RepID=UPI0026527917|nr:SDR family oxidoreductase [Burkholderia oklahomensis]MDN7674978.1 SDR family oxidoreductase [Burkholderia oklahomensis]